MLGPKPAGCRELGTASGRFSHKFAVERNEIGTKGFVRVCLSKYYMEIVTKR